MKRVYSSYNATLVHHFRNLLEAEGIETEVRNAILSSAMGELPPAECQAEVWVGDRDLEKSEAILRGKPAGPDWQCSCGETLGAQFTQCWCCGNVRTPAPPTG